jgi:molecular chaperone HscB
MLENYFKLFKLPQQCEINVNELKARFRELQQVVHPDQHATGTNKEQLIAGQMSAYTNDAYQTLKNPLSRYKYLLSLNGFEFTEHTHQDTGFLMLQMQLREDLAEISEEKDPEQAIENFQKNLSNMTSNQTGAFKCAFLAEDFKQAYQEVVKLQFFDKLLQDVERLEDQLL